MTAIIKNIKPVFLAVLFVIVVVIWYAVFYFETRQNFLIHFFDIGQGDAIFIEVPNGNQILIDGGSSIRILDKLGGVMPFWDRSLDLIILTHPHADHLDGLLEVLKRYDADMIMETGVNHSLPEYEEWRKLLNEKEIRVITAKRGQRVRLAESAGLDVLMPFRNFSGESPKNIHESMIVAKLYYGSNTAFLTGDAEKSLEYQLLFYGGDLNSDILKVGHHGSKTSTSEEFLKAVSPELAIISVGRKNRYGHPNQEVIDRIIKAGAQVRRTDQNGDILIKW